MLGYTSWQHLFAAALWGKNEGKHQGSAIIDRARRASQRREKRGPSRRFLGERPGVMAAIIVGGAVLPPPNYLEAGTLGEKL